jgi:hypothetical protein
MHVLKSPNKVIEFSGADYDTSRDAPQELQSQHARVAVRPANRDPRIIWIRRELGTQTLGILTFDPFLSFE